MKDPNKYLLMSSLEKWSCTTYFMLNQQYIHLYTLSLSSDVTEITGKYNLMNTTNNKYNGNKLRPWKNE
jgi:hypothetical protein